MPRPFFPHTLSDVVRAVDGGLGLIAADLPDGRLCVLQRSRRAGGYRMTVYADTQRSAVVSRQSFSDRRAAINHYADHIGLDEKL